jgi:hypothetical protein
MRHSAVKTGAALVTVALSFAAGCSSSGHVGTPTSPRPMGAILPAVEQVAGDQAVRTTPAQPIHGSPTQITIAGRVRGGKYVRLRSVVFGDGTSSMYGPIASCVPNSLASSAPRGTQEYSIHFSHTWNRGGTYPIKAYIGSICPIKHVRPIVVRFRLRVT